MLTETSISTGIVSDFVPKVVRYLLILIPLNVRVAVGSSSFPCAETYAGPRAFSEPETKSFAAFLERFASQTKIILSFHSFGQYLMWPYGHTTSPTHNNAILVRSNHLIYLLVL